MNSSPLNSKIKGNNITIRNKGLLALSPLFVFLLVYLISSVIAQDFYKVPISAAFIFASVYALLITRGRSLEERVHIFSSGAGKKNVLLMVWIFIFAGAFAQTAKEIGAIDATVSMALDLLPGKWLFAGLFIASCFISMAIGTSVGTIVALVPVAAGIASEATLSGATGLLTNTSFITAIIVGGAFFGDNLSFISDTTIAATRTQECSMADKFKINIRIVAPAALVAALIYVILGSSVMDFSRAADYKIYLIIPYLLVILLSLLRINVLIVLTVGVFVNMFIGLFTESFTWIGFLQSLGNGVSGMADLIVVTLLAGGMLEIIKVNGGLDYIVNGMLKRIRGPRGAELSIAALVSLANVCTANNTIAIITVGKISRDIATYFGLDPRRCASILDTFSCLVQGFLPYGAQLLMAASLADISSISIAKYLYYPALVGICALSSILLRRRVQAA